MTKMIPSVCISALCIALVVLFGLVYNLWKYARPSTPVAATHPPIPVGTSRPGPVVASVARGVPEHLYRQFTTDFLARKNETRVTCSPVKMMYLVVCPGRGWDRSRTEAIDWRSTPPPADATRLYILNNCLGDIFMGAVGTGVPSLLNGAKLAAEEIQHYDIPFGSTLQIFARSPCQMLPDIRGNRVLQCKDCTCPPTDDGMGCAAPGFACSEVEFESNATGEVSYRVSHDQGFTTTYLLVPDNDKCDAMGEHLEFTRQEILKQCPEPLAFTDADDPVRITACVNECKVCQMAEAAKNCQCTEDADCFTNCPNYSFHMNPNTSRPPLECAPNNRCASKLKHRCSDHFRDNLTYQDVYCCANLSPEDCALLNKFSNP